MVSTAVRRQQVAYAVRRGLSCRRACRLVRIARSGLDYESKLIKRDASAEARLRELAGQYPRYGYRRVRILAARRGYSMSPGRRTVFGVLLGSRCRANARVGVLPRVGRALFPRPARIKFGRTTSCSIRARTARNSSASPSWTSGPTKHSRSMSRAAFGLAASSMCSLD